MERWRKVEEFPNYSVSDLGRIRCDGFVDAVGKRHSPRVKVLVPGRDGRIRATLTKGGKSYTRLVHPLVLIAFVGPRPKGKVACHWDDVPSNNVLTNLRWGTRRENAHDYIRNGRHKGLAKTCCPRQHSLEEPNLVAASLRRGERTCKACHAESVYSKRAGVAFSVPRADDRYYKIINNKEEK